MAQRSCLPGSQVWRGARCQRSSAATLLCARRQNARHLSPCTAAVVLQGNSPAVSRADARPSTSSVSQPTLFVQLENGSRAHFETILDRLSSTEANTSSSSDAGLRPVESAREASRVSSAGLLGTLGRFFGSTSASSPAATAQEDDGGPLHSAVVMFTATWWVDSVAMGEAHDPHLQCHKLTRHICRCRPPQVRALQHRSQGDHAGSLAATRGAGRWQGSPRRRRWHGRSTCCHTDT